MISEGGAPQHFLPVLPAAVVDMEDRDGTLAPTLLAGWLLALACCVYVWVGFDSNECALKASKQASERAVAKSTTAFGHFALVVGYRERLFNSPKADRSICFPSRISIPTSAYSSHHVPTQLHRDICCWAGGVRKELLCSTPPFPIEGD